MEPELLDNLFVYKKSIALFSAYQLGLFEVLKEKEMINRDICNNNGWNVENVFLLCRYLADMGYLVQTNENWVLKTEVKKNIDYFISLCSYETYMYHNWMTTEQIKCTLITNIGERTFDLVGFSEEEQIKYNNIVFGSNMKIIAYQILRTIKKKRDICCLELGRSNGIIGNILKKHLANIQVDSLSMTEYGAIKNEYDAVFIINTIHYIASEQLVDILSKCKNVIREDGVIFIADFFYEKGTVFQETLLMDWLTHGGVNHISKLDLINVIKKSGFKTYETKYFLSISTDLFILCKE